MTNTKRGLPRDQKAERVLDQRNRPKALKALPKLPKPPCPCACHTGDGQAHPGKRCRCKLPIPPRPGRTDDRRAEGPR